MDRNEQLDKAGMPYTLIKLLDDHPGEDTVKKYNTVIKMIGIKTVLYVLGPDSPKKELLCAKWLWFFMQQRKKTGRWLTPSRIPASFGELPTGGGVVVFQGIDLLMPQQQKTVAQAVRDWITDGRFVILSASSLPVLEECFGKGLTYLTHHAISVEVKVETPKILKV